jgi:hypothetical protein
VAAVGADRPDGVVAGDAADAATAVGGGAGLVEPGDRAAVVGVAGRRAEVEELLQRQLAVEDVAADQAALTWSDSNQSSSRSVMLMVISRVTSAIVRTSSPR